MGILKLVSVAAYALLVLVGGVLGQTQTEERLYSRCGSNTTNSTFEVNLKTVLTSVALSNEIDYGFYNVSAGESPDRAYAFALCRGDVSPAACRACVNHSSSDLRALCPTQKEAIAYYGNCMLRYSNNEIFGEQDGPVYYKWSNTNASDVDGLNRALETLLPGLRDRASSGDSRKKYAYGDANFTLLGRVYALVQCTPDLTKRGCANCLDNAFRYVSKYFPGKQGGRVFRPVCNFRYELNQFYETTSHEDPLEKGTRNTAGRNIIIVVATTFGFLLLVSLFCAAFRQNWLIKKLGSR
uniref:Gnk2-homologous domain-containing protein n=1 Tax=Kalanchoe fedtschenkoi TaxID=63787 RepID=A0A7N1A442_KALFE